MLDPIKPSTFDSTEIGMRLAALKNQAEEYLVSLHTPTEMEKKTLAERLKSCLTEKQRIETIREAYHCNIKVKIDIYHLAAAQWKPKGNRIYLHPLMIFKPSDFPKDLQASECKNGVEEYVSRFKKWLSDNSKIEIDDNKLDKLKPMLVFFFFLWRDYPEKRSQVIDFMIAHEVGHIHYKHKTRDWSPVLSIILTTGLAVAIWSQISLLLALTSIIFIYTISSTAFRCLSDLYYRSDERSADLIALNLLKSSEGAEISLEIFNKMEKRQWDLWNWYEKVYKLVMNPESVFQLRHGSHLERLAEIKKAHDRAKTIAVQTAQPMKA